MAIILGVPLLYILSQLNEPVKIYMDDYGYFPLFLTSSFIGIFVVIDTSRRISAIWILRELGEMSIAIYVWNFFFVGINRSILSDIMTSLGIYSEGNLISLTFILSMIELYLIGKITMKYFPFIYGIKK